MTEPIVSVVVATHDRPARLRRLLDGLRAQTLPSDSFEVVVVDDGSSAATAAMLEREASGGGLRLRVARHTVARGAGPARNTGWRAAQAPLVAFTDDDCVPDPQWLEVAIGAHREHPDAIVQGRTEADPAERARGGLLSRTVEIHSLGPQYETCNIFYPRSLLASLGGFDEGFGLRPGGEDTDLAWRALERGHEAVFAPDALVYHAVEPLGVRGSLRNAARWTETVRIFAQHPQTRTMLTRRVFWNIWHYLLVRSLVALLLPPSLRRLILTNHLRALRKRARAAGAGAWAVPYLIVYDLIETGAVIRGGVRYRTPVL